MPRVSLRRRPAARAAGGALAAGLVLLARRRRDLGLPRPVSLATAAAVPPLVHAIAPAGRGRAALTWAAFMWAYKIAFELPYDHPGRLRARLLVDPPIVADTWIGRGVPPGQRLQRRLRRPPRLSALDHAATAVYVTWEAEPHLALAWILARRPEHFPVAALRLGTTFAATLVGYALVPQAPPWWASEREGRMAREVRRVTAEAMAAWRRRPRPRTDHNAGANPWAAMPSDHFASSLTAAAVLWPVDRRLGVAAGAYALTLGAVLVYTGEHYVADLAAGAALAAAVNPLAGAVALRLQS